MNEDFEVSLCQLFSILRLLKSAKCYKSCSNSPVEYYITQCNITLRKFNNYWVIERPSQPGGLT